MKISPNPRLPRWWFGLLAKREGIALPELSFSMGAPRIGMIWGTG
jgi:hypothetical protein